MSAVTDPPGPAPGSPPEWPQYHGRRRIREIRVSGRHVLRTTEVFDTFWLFAARRQAAFMQRLGGAPPPWTDDPILGHYRFTNVYRASDRVSQYLIRHVIYHGSQLAEEVVFRTLLFKLFNRIETWERLVVAVGVPSWRSFDFERYATVLDGMAASGESVYSGAYIMPSPAFGQQRKYRNHLHLLRHIMSDRGPRRIAQATTLRDVFESLRAYPSLGDFLAYQFTIDLNYSDVIDFSEMDFVIAGPGARSGLQKCFVGRAGLSESDLIRVVVDLADSELARLGLRFASLWGRRLHLIDCQNLFCEVDKYARVAHPEYNGPRGRSRLKRRFVPTGLPLPQWYPPKWGLAPAVGSRPNH